MTFFSSSKHNSRISEVCSSIQCKWTVTANSNSKNIISPEIDWTSYISPWKSWKTFHFYFRKRAAWTFCNKELVLCSPEETMSLSFKRDEKMLMHLSFLFKYLFEKSAEEITECFPRYLYPSFSRRWCPKYIFLDVLDTENIFLFHCAAFWLLFCVDMR